MQRRPTHPPHPLRARPQIRSLAPLTALGACTSLQELYVAANKVSAIEGLQQLIGLTVLELGSNRCAGGREVLTMRVWAKGRGLAGAWELRAGGAAT